MNKGIVIKNMNGYFYVQDQEGSVHECKVRGRLKQGRYSLLVGDRVQFSSDGFIEAIEPRFNSMVRPAVANVDQVILVVAAHEPDINILLFNKLILMIEHADIPLRICINKSDLADEATYTLMEEYRKIGYEVIATSTRTGEGIEQLKGFLEGKVTAFAGPSGVGKSSLLNAIEPKFAFQTGQVSEKIKRGRHTTRHASLFSLNEDSFIMDTPGFSSIDFKDISLERLPSLYPEFLVYEKKCKFSPCYHEHEPICGVRSALKNGEISPQRYDSYLTIRQEISKKRRR